QYYFDSILPRVPVPVVRQVTTNLEKMKLPTKLSGVTGDSRHGSEDTARRPSSVKASLSVSFGQRAPHRASTRDSSLVRRTVTQDDHRRSSSPFRRSVSREGPYNDRQRSTVWPYNDRSSHDREGIVTITGPGIQKKEGITEASVTTVDTDAPAHVIGAEAGVVAGAGAGVGARMSIDLVHLGIQAKRRLLLPRVT
uniref:Pre-mRNA-splicing factor 38 C-terminal domain-containing protein n=1 Tax=Aegilops tauschii subsp. strangulata TaxID=200361 RepID=A0A452Y4Y7_AEGTS